MFEQTNNFLQKALQSAKISMVLRVVEAYSAKVASPVGILNALEAYGWNLECNNGIKYLFYMNESLVWKTASMQKEKFYELVKKKENKNKLLGTEILWKDSNIRANIFLRTAKQMSHPSFPYTNVILHFDADKKFIHVKEGLEIVDVNWYLSIILPAFSQENFLIESYSYDEKIVKK